MDLRTVSIHSERLSLVPTSEAYAHEIFAEFTPEVTAYMFPKPPEVIEETLAFLSAAREELRSGESLNVAVLARDSGEFLGCAGLHHVPSRTPELGIWIKRGAHGHGYGREAVTALAGWALANLDFDYLVYPVDRRNGASRRIPESLGGAVKAEYDKVNESGVTLDILEYRIERSALRRLLRA
jgi:RimJ/RimL family protein N-acetyltransferase